MSELVNNYDISVIVPVYNVEEYLAECLDSVIKFTQCNIEVLIIDDGSIDSSAQIAKEYSKKYPFVKYYYEENAGLSHARNYGVTIATGKYIIFLDSDDIVEQDAYDKMFALAEKYDSDMTICNVARFNSSGGSPSWLHKKAFNSLNINTHITKQTNLIYDTTSWNKLIKRSFFLEHNFNFPEGMLYEDIPVTIPMHYLANNVSVLNSFGYLWRVRDGASKSITQRASELKNFEDRMGVIKMVDEFFDANVKEEDLIIAKQLKLLEIDFMIYVNQCDSIDEELLAKYIGDIKAYINENIDTAVFSRLNSINRQKYEYIMSGNIDKLIKLLDYQRSGYNSAPLIEENGEFSLILPKDLFDVQGDSLRDARQYTPNINIDNIETSDSSISLDCYTYFSRINIKDSSEQKIKASFLNEKTFELYNLDVTPIDGTEVTERFGTSVDKYNKQVSNYNYDGTAYNINIDFSKLDLEKLIGENKILIEFDNRIASGSLLLAGMELQKRRGARNKTILVGDYSIVIEFRERVVIGFVVAKNDNFASKIYCKDESLVFELENPADSLVLVDTTDEINAVELNKIDDGIFAVPVSNLNELVRYESFIKLNGNEKLVPLLRRHKMLRIDSTTNDTVLISSFMTYKPIILVNNNVAEVKSCEQEGNVLRVSTVAKVNNHTEIKSAYICVYDAQQEKYINLAKGRVTFGKINVFSKFNIDFGKDNVTKDLYDDKRDIVIKYVFNDGHTEIKSLFSKSNFSYQVRLETLSLKFFRTRFGNVRLNSNQEWREEEATLAQRNLLKLENYPKFRKEPLNDKLIVFESMWGSKYSCNPKFIYEYIDKNYPDYTCVWSLKDARTPIKGNGIRVRRGSQEYYHYLATAKYLVNNVNFETDFVKRKGQVFVQTMHGTPLKSFGLDIKDEFPTNASVDAFIDKCNKWDHLIVQNKFMEDKAYSCFRYTKNILTTGYPRTDILYNSSPKRVQALKEKFGLPLDKKIILYAPTWRIRNKFDMMIDIDDMKRRLGDEYILVLRRHYWTGEYDFELDENDTFAYDMTNYNSVEDLYIISDMMITDYSSVMFDYAILKKPMIFFTYDVEEYADRLRGTYIDIVKEAPGPVVYDSNELVTAIENLDKEMEKCQDRTKAFYDKFTTYENGRSCAKVVEKVIKPIGRREKIKRIKRKLRIK